MEGYVESPYERIVVNRLRGKLFYDQSVSKTWPLNPDPSQPPKSIQRRTLVIWFAPGCQACKKNEPVFEYIQQNPGMFDVYRIEITRELQQLYPHVTTVPLYDVIVPMQGSSSVYGPETLLDTIQNNDLSNETGLGRYFPDVEKVYGTTSLQ